MRAPKRRHPRKDERWVPSTQDCPAKLAERASYIISTEHKDYLTEAGPGRLRTDATPCPRGIDFEDVQTWLRDAISRGDASADFTGEFPRYVWARRDDRTYEARLSNAVLGQYKGYPIDEREAPWWL